MKISAAAIFVHGKIYTLPPPARHYTIIHWMVKDLHVGEQNQYWRQGFVTDAGVFVGRKTAFVIAQKAGQLEGLVKTHPKDTLFSEDLW